MTLENNKINKLTPWGYKYIDIKWLDIVLNIVFKKEEIINLLKNFGISFLKNIKQISQKEMVIVLLCDAPPNDLLKIVKSIFKEKYNNFLSYNQFKLLYKKLLSLSFEKLSEIYTQISTNEKLKNYITDPRYKVELTKEDVIDYIFKELYTLSKIHTKRILKNYLNN